MKKVLNIGSVNIDHVYRVPHFVRPGETLASGGYRRFAGGKGFNQSVALARAGAKVAHAGCIGGDGGWLRDRLETEGVDVAALRTVDIPTGHAIIQVDDAGENAILLDGGANHCLDASLLESALSRIAPGDWLLLQNETTRVAEAIRLGKAAGCKVVFNPAPMTPEVAGYPLEDVDLVILNETEAAELAGASEPGAVVTSLRTRHPDLRVLLTLGARGAVFHDGEQLHSRNAYPVKAVDTTAAGDTFIGFFLASWLDHADPAAALDFACRAAALSVTRPGAMESIPTREEALAF
jgi:ribokinase